MTAMLLPTMAAAAPASAPRATAAEQAPYYLALGDSLAQGVQPDATGHSVKTTQGYADDLWSRYHASSPDLRLAKLGCPGEKTGTMMHGGICAYPLGSQLAQATAFLATHRVKFVTLDIGANNIDGCVSAANGLDQVCLAAGLAAVQRDLPLILQALRSTSSKPAGRAVPMVAMTYYDPFLAAALKGGPDLAVICAYTWMCTPPPIGPNIHATAAGYAVIAQVFARQIG